MDQNRFTDILRNAASDGERVRYAISDNWLQGRTTYGGLSAALCLHAVKLSHPDLPTLRSAQVNFVGPSTGELVASTRILRQGKSVSFVEAELHGSDGLATHVVFCFGAARKSELRGDYSPAIALPDRANCEVFGEPGKTPPFAEEFECLLAEGDKPISASDKTGIKMWIRHRDEAATDLVALLGLADMPPPAVMPMFKHFKPVSSINWSLNFLNDDIQTDDRWWLLESVAENARDGYSSQDMRIWNSSGELIITARQTIAIFY